MQIERLKVESVRNLNLVDIVPSKKLNFIFGANGSGKSSLLEAIHYLGYGRSFRTNSHINVISEGKSSFTVFSTLSDKDRSLQLGLERRKSDYIVKIDGEKVQKLTALVSLFPILIFSPQSNELLSGQPSLRRKLLDWGLFHVEHTFSELYSKYNAVLTQRNSLLKKIGNKEATEEELVYWNEIFCDLAEIISKKRHEYCVRLNETYQKINKYLLPNSNIQLQYQRGWDSKTDLKDVLSKKVKREIYLGHSLYGPHKSELKIILNQKIAMETLSRGEQRMLIAGIMLAQYECLKNSVGKKALFVLDDLGAELDAENRSLFLDYLSKLDLQAFISAIEPNDFSSVLNKSEHKVFHVEHGNVKEEL